MPLNRLLVIALLFCPVAAFASDEHDHDKHTHEDHAESEEHHDHDEHAHDDHGDDDSDHVTRVDGLEILHAWAQATDDHHGRVFMEIANESDVDLILLGGDTEIGGDVVVKAMSYSGGAKAVEIGTFPIKAGTEVDLTPDGLFLEIADLEMHLEEGTSFEMHIDVDPIGEVEIVVEVEAEDASNHSHAGHNH